MYEKARREAEEIISMVGVIMAEYEEEDKLHYLRTLATGLKPLLEKLGPEDDIKKA